VSGWASFPDIPQERVELESYKNGQGREILMRISASLQRRDATEGANRKVSSWASQQCYNYERNSKKPRCVEVRAQETLRHPDKVRCDWPEQESVKLGLGPNHRLN
jgi:hypothetical protein